MFWDSASATPCTSRCDLAGMVLTVGHGSRPLEALIGLLQGAGATLLVDVRAYPASRRHPQFNRDRLAAALAACGVAYLWEGRELGGLRRPAPGSPHLALEPGLRGFADHMTSAAFRAALARLAALGEAERPALLCAERDPMQCHRRLVADALVVAGTKVIHLLDPDHGEDHRLDPRLRLSPGGLVYDVGAGGQRTFDFSGSGSPGSR